MNDFEIEQRLKERDEIGIVTQRRFDKKKWEQTRYAKKKKFDEEVTRRVATLLAQGPMFKHTVRALVDRKLKEEVERIIERRIKQGAKDIADINRIQGPPLPHIVQTIADVTGVSIGDLCGPRRQRKLAWPRFLGFHIVRVTRPDLSLPRIGHLFGGRDHTTVIHGLRKMATLASEPPFSEWLMHPSIHDLLAWKAEEEKETTP